MPYVISKDAKIYYEVKGSGPSLSLIEGIGYATWMWVLQVDDLSRDHKLIIFDNRGVGKSDKPNYPYTMDLFAEDLKAVLDAAGVSQTHVLGVSMGGMIAQKFALKYPEMVKSLILTATHHGGKDIDPTPTETIQLMFGPPPPHIRDERELYRLKMKSYALSESWIEKNEQLFEYILDLRLREIPPPEALLNQAAAVVNFDASASLHKIACPVLIIHGTEDRVVPVGNAYKLHSKLPNSTLIIFKRTGHVINIERAREFNELVRRFISKVEQGAYKSLKQPIVVEEELREFPF